MLTRNNLALGLILLALITALLPLGEVQAQDSTPEPKSEDGQVLCQKTYNMKVNYGSMSGYKANMLYTLWATSPGQKAKDGYKLVSDSFTGNYTFNQGNYWLNGVFGPYTYGYGWTDSEVGDIKQGGGACDTLSFIAETLACAGFEVPKKDLARGIDGYINHGVLLSGMDPKYSISIATYSSTIDYKRRDGHDVLAINPYQKATLWWKVEGDNLTLWVTTGDDPKNLKLPQLAPAASPAAKTSEISSSPWYARVNWWLIATIVALVAIVWWIYKSHPYIQAEKYLSQESKPKKAKRVPGRWGKTIWIWWKIWGVIYAATFVGLAAESSKEEIAKLLPDPQGSWELTLVVPNWVGYAAIILGLTAILVRSYIKRQGWQQPWQILPPPQAKKRPPAKKWVKWVLGIVIFSLVYASFAVTGGGLKAGWTTPTPTPTPTLAPSAGACNGRLLGKLLTGSQYVKASPPTKSHAALNAAIGRITPELEKIYAEAESQTGVPCEALVGIHFVEANNRLSGSLISGRAIGSPEPDQGGKVYGSLLETAIDAAGILKSKVGMPRKGYQEFVSVEQLITALSLYNGGGNRNCREYPYPIPYSGCPRQFVGEDDPYAVNWLTDRHNTMYLLYCADHTACYPQVFKRPGSFTVTFWFYQNVSSRR